MEIRVSQMSDLDEILSIYDYARRFMASHGNPNQWGQSKPTRETVLSDILSGQSRVCMDNGKIAAVFFYAEGEDSTYAEIDGAWPNARPYAVVHRIASAEGTHGAATFCLNHAYELSHHSLRIDTHKDNKPMQALLAKLSFRPCGIIRIADGSPRLAYQKCED